MRELLAVIEVTVCNGNDSYLLGSKPEWECTCVLLNEVSESSLVAAEGCSVDDIGTLLCTVNVDILHAELLCKKHVNLNCYDSVLLAVNILVLNVKLRTVECSLVDTDFVVNAEVVKDFSHCSLCSLPLFSSTIVLVLGFAGSH